MNLIHKNMLKETSANYSRKEKQSWKEFKSCCKGKDIVVIGCGKAGALFMKEYGRKFKPAYAIDEKNTEVFLKYQECEEIEIYPYEVMDGLDMEKTIFVVTPIKQYQEISEKLIAYGAKHIFSFYLMEKVRLINKAIVLKYRIKEVFIKKREKYTGWNAYNMAMRKKFAQYKDTEIQNDKIVFTSFGGLGYNDHGKYITEELLRRNLDLDIVWLLNEVDTEVPCGVRIVDNKNNDAKVYELATAKMWIANTDLPLYVTKRRGQIFIETKHWTAITLKSFYLDANTINKNRVQRYSWKHNGRMIDFILTGSKFDSKSCKRGFRPKGQCKELGSARVDVLFNDQGVADKTREKFNISTDSYVILYAPTYRFEWNKKDYDYISGEYLLDYERLKRCIEKKYNRKCIILLKLHPGIMHAYDDVLMPEFVINVSQYEDTQELIVTSDMVITDYSSLMFEPAYVGKPVFLYATDLKKYLQQDYNMLLDIHSLPFPLAQDNEQLEERITSFDCQVYENKVNQFLDKFNVKEDGHACERIGDFIVQLLGM